MTDYILFFGILLVGFAFFLFRPKVKSEYDPVMLCESPIERRLYYALLREGYLVVPQVRCGSYRIDLALPAFNIAIECDGKAYHSSPKQKAHDRRKNAYLKSNGWRVLRFSGSRINRKLNEVLAKIESEAIKNRPNREG